MLTSKLFWVPVDSSGSPILLLVSKVPSKDPVTESQARLHLQFKLEELAKREGPKAVLAAVEGLPELEEMVSWTPDPEGIPSALARSQGAWNLLSTVDWKASTVEEVSEEMEPEMSNPEQTFAAAVETIVSNW